MSTLETIRAPLFVPADRPERFAKAATSGADAVILDLEDAVAEGAKETARSALRSDFTDKPVIVRVNAIGSAAFEADLAAVATLRPDAIMLPKAEDVHQIGALNDVLPCPVIALIESARGLAIARKIAATKGVRKARCQRRAATPRAMAHPGCTRPQCTIACQRVSRASSR